jgi:uncharacterized protein
MADFNNYQNRMAQNRTQTGAMIDEGLRAYMLKVYNLMALALVITGVAAFGFAMLATTSDPAAAVATLPNGKMLTSLGALVYALGRYAGSARTGFLP